jgi:hypothetical protein
MAHTAKSAGAPMTDWLNRAFSLNDLVKTGIYVFINHRLQQFYVGKATFCFGARFLMELGKKQSGEKTLDGYDLVFDHPDTELIYEKAFHWMERYNRHFDLDALERDVFLDYNIKKYPNYTYLNKRNVKTWLHQNSNRQ